MDTSDWKALFLLSCSLDVSDDQAGLIVTVSIDNVTFRIGHVIQLWTVKCLEKDKGFS